MFDDDFALFFDDNNDTVVTSYQDKDSVSLDQSWCHHDFKPVLLLTSTVFDCAKCGMHKELYDKQNNSPKWGGL